MPTQPHNYLWNYCYVLLSVYLFTTVFASSQQFVLQIDDINFLLVISSFYRHNVTLTTIIVRKFKVKHNSSNVI